MYTYRTLFTLFPDNLEYGLKLASAQTTSSHGQDALATVAGLRKMPSPGSNDPRIDQAEVVAQASLGNFTQEGVAAERTAGKAQALGARLLTANARHRQCWALHRLGQEQDAHAACEEAKRIFIEAGDRVSVASLLVTMGSVLHEEGDLAAAVPITKMQSWSTERLGLRADLPLR